jgi:hypothetical protein
MKRRTKLSAVLACVLVFGSINARAQDSNRVDIRDEVAALRATVESLRAEVTVLRMAMARLELDQRRKNIRQIEVELEAVRAENARLAEFDRARQQDLQDVEGLLTRGDVAPEERLNVESTRADLAIHREREITGQREAVRLRESELLRRLEAEEQVRKSLEEALKVTRGESQ